MPTVTKNGKTKHYPYTKKGMAKAKAAAKKGGKIMYKKGMEKY